MADREKEGFKHILNINAFPTNKGPYERHLFHAWKERCFPRVLVAGDFVSVKTFPDLDQEFKKVLEVNFWDGGVSVLLDHLNDAADFTEEMSRALREDGWNVEFNKSKEQ